MGDPKYSRKKSARPRNPWQRNLLKEELELVGSFGLRPEQVILLWRLRLWSSFYSSFESSILIAVI